MGCFGCWPVGMATERIYQCHGEGKLSGWLMLTVGPDVCQGHAGIGSFKENTNWQHDIQEMFY